MSGWDDNAYGGNSLQSPSYNTNLRGQPPVDSYYNNSQQVSVPVPNSGNSYQAQTPSASYSRSSNPEKTAFGASGVVNGLEQSNWQNKDSATNCSLCEAAFSTLKKRKHNCRVCGKVFCGNCSSDKLNVAHKGMERVCFICFSAHSSLTTEEQKIVAEVCQDLGEYPQLQTMVFRKKDSGPSNRHHAILVISRYQIICLRRSAPKSNIKPLYLLDLTRVSIPRKSTLLLEFGRQTGVPIVEQYDTAKAPEILLTLRSQHASICLGMPQHCQLQVDASDEDLLPAKPLPPMGVAGGFPDSYRAWCNFYGQEPSEELLQYITDSVERTPNVLDLSYCPGIEPGTNITFDLQPIFQALRYNSYFLGLSLCDVVAKGAMELLAPCLKANRVLTRLHLRKLTTSHLTLIGSALAENGKNALQEIDFSGTTLSEKATRSLALSMVVKEYGLRSFKASKCDLSAKSVGVFFREGFLPSPEVTIMLEELDLSENKMDEEASLLLQVWISKIGARGSLSKLNLRKTGASLGLVLPALENLTKLEELDISNSTLDLDTAQILSRVISGSSTFKKLDVSSCNLAPSCISVIIAAIVKNVNLRQVSLNLSDNPIDDSNINLLLGAFTSSRVLETLDLSRIKLGEKGILQLFDTIIRNVTSLKTLIIQDFFGSISGHISGALVGHSLADMILQIPSIKKLDISTTKHSMFTSPPAHVFLPFLQRMQRNETLLELVMTGNRLADKLAVTIAEMLRCNTKLVSLNIDDNKITLTGFQALEYAMQRNRTLQKFEYPTLDVSRCVKSNEMSTEKLSILFSILSNIHLAVSFNQSQGIHSYLQNMNEYVPPNSGPVQTYEDQPVNTPTQPIAPSNSDWNQGPSTTTNYVQDTSYSQGGFGSGGGYETNTTSGGYDNSGYNNTDTTYNNYGYENTGSYENTGYEGQNGGFDGNNFSYESSNAPMDADAWNSYSYQQPDDNQSGGSNNDLFNALASVLDNPSSNSFDENSGAPYGRNDWQY